MVVIEIGEFTKEDKPIHYININGHADYDVSGKDIVCAAVTTLFFTLLEAVEEETTIIQGETGDGHAYIEYVSTDKMDIVERSIVRSWVHLVDNYPNNVQIKNNLTKNKEN